MKFRQLTNTVSKLVLSAIFVFSVGGATVLKAEPLTQQVVISVEDHSDEMVSVSFGSFSAGDRVFVLVHGLGLNMSYWEHQVPVFEDYGRVIVMDLPGHGASDKPSINYSLSFMAEAVMEVITANHVDDKVVLVGHSLGVGISRQFYRQFPDHVEAIIALDGPLYFQEDPELLSLVESEETWIRTWHGAIDFMTGPPIDANTAARMRHDMKGTPGYVTQSAAIDLVAAPDANAPINVPVLALQARNYSWGDDIWQMRTEHVAPDLEFHFLEGGHFLHYEMVDKVNGLIENFLQNL